MNKLSPVLKLCLPFLFSLSRCVFCPLLFQRKTTLDDKQHTFIEKCSFKCDMLSSTIARTGLTIWLYNKFYIKFFAKCGSRWRKSHRITKFYSIFFLLLFFWGEIFIYWSRSWSWSQQVTIHRNFFEGFDQTTTLTILLVGDPQLIG